MEEESRTKAKGPQFIDGRARSAGDKWERAIAPRKEQLSLGRKELSLHGKEGIVPGKGGTAGTPPTCRQ